MNNFVTYHRPFVVAVDGLAGTGKTSACVTASSFFGLKYLDSGRVYRRLALSLLEQGAPLDNLQTRHLAEVAYRLGDLAEAGVLDPDTVNRPGDALADMEVAEAASLIGTLPGVRGLVGREIRTYVSESADCWIISGRDAVTSLFPEADVRVVLHAPAEVREDRQPGAGPRDARDPRHDLGLLSPGVEVIDTGINDQAAVTLKLAQMIARARPWVGRDRAI